MPPPPDRHGLAARFRRVRAQSEALAAPLSAEDMLVQSMPDASPTKWHLAHTTWFFEEFVLARFDPGHRWADERWRVLFNSYYEAVGPRHRRPERGVLSRPSLDEVRAWRRRVDDQVASLIGGLDEAGLEVVLLGTHHEEQHQELMLTDIKHALFGNPLRPCYLPTREASRELASGCPASASARWVLFEERIARIGHDGRSFAFDNERPSHRAVVASFLLAEAPVSNDEYGRFIEDGGYRRPELWLSDGWTAAQSAGWTAPLYWERNHDGWSLFTMRGLESPRPDAPVTHVSHFEADAYARWAGARLPTEQEWEVAAGGRRIDGNFVESGELAPRTGGGSDSANGVEGPRQLFGDVWEWTASAYLPYPGFRALEGALGEYNGKFMSGQMVLRGGSCFSPQDHVRHTYRNFFAPTARWQMSGVRLARDA